MKWKLDFIRPIKLTSRYIKIWYILMAIDYVTKKVETKAFQTNIVVVTFKFMYEYILILFGCPL